MILKSLVQFEAVKFLKSILHLHPNKTFAESLLREPEWTKFIELLHARSAQLDIEGYVKSKQALVLFIESATLNFVDTQLKNRLNSRPMPERASEVSGTNGNQIYEPRADSDS